LDLLTIRRVFISIARGAYACLMLDKVLRRLDPSTIGLSENFIPKVGFEEAMPRMSRHEEMHYYCDPHGLNEERIIWNLTLIL
jgi:hypothetical protein